MFENKKETIFGYRFNISPTLDPTGSGRSFFMPKSKDKEYNKQKTTSQNRPGLTIKG